MSYKGEIMAVVSEIATLLQEKGVHLATAESCTGGKVASLLTSLSGASEWYRGGVVAYTREAKMGVLGVPEEELSGGLVTARCAKAMARMAAERLGTDYAVATTGVCGPSHSEGVAPNAAWVGTYCKGRCEARFIELPDEGRTVNIEQMAEAALRQLLQEMKEEEA